MTRTFLNFFKTVILALLRGSRAYYLWVALLGAFALAGAVAFLLQVNYGLVTTAMTDQVSWGAYIANFSFVVGLTDAAVMVAIPAFLYKQRKMQEVVWIALYLALAGIVMALLFVVVDLGRPERGWHLIPLIGSLNFPSSMLSWDVVVLNLYFVITGTLVLYTLFTWSRGKNVPTKVIAPWVIASTIAAVGLHTVTAFLYSWLGARPFWNAAIVAPRFLASAFVVGPAFLIISLQIIRRFMSFDYDEKVIRLLRQIITVSLLVNLFLLGAELFKEFKTDSLHVASAVYLFFGLHGQNMLVPYIWAAMALNITAAIILVTPRLAHRRKLLNAACLMAFVGIWIEKGMGLIVPGFVPSPLGDVVEYTPSLVELFICAGVWAFGVLVFTLLTKIGVPLQLQLSEANRASAAGEVRR